MKKAYLVLLAAALLALSLVEAAAAAGSNATRIADTLMEGEEFLMESETGRRILAGQRPGVNYKTLTPNRPVCNGDVYGNCNSRAGKIVTDRKCDLQNHCGRK